MWWAWWLWAAAAGAAGGAAAAAPPPTAAPGVPVFARGEGGYYCVKIPSLVAWGAGGREVLLAFGEGRRGSCADSAPTDLVLKRSQDGGRTWGALAVVAGDGANTFGNAAPVVSRREGEPDVLVVPFCRNNREVLVTRSGDGGLTWFDEPPVPQPHLVMPHWRWVGLGPPAGLRLKNGRLLIPAYHGSTRLDGTFTQGHTVFSDDGGASWELGEPYGGLHQVNENQVVEFGDGELLSNARGVLPWRLQARSLDGGRTFRNVAAVRTLGSSLDGCEGSLLKLRGSDDLLFSGVAGPALFRQKLGISRSDDRGRSWKLLRRVTTGAAGYSSLANLRDGVAVLYEAAARKRVIFEPDEILFEW